MRIEMHTGMFEMTTRKQFTEAWKSHIQDLNRLGFSCSKQDWKKVKEIVKELNEIVDRTSLTDVELTN